MVKTASDFWVVGKKSEQREFYVVINQRSANLIEINGELNVLFIFHSCVHFCCINYKSLDVTRWMFCKKNTC